MEPKLRNPRKCRNHRAAAACLPVCGVIMVLLAGCAAPKLPGAAAREVRVSEFARAGEIGRNAGESTNQPATTAAAGTQDVELSDQPSRLQADEPAPRAAAPVLAASGGASVKPGRRVIVDSLVGQVNGAPIYAEAVFAPIDDQLRAVRQRTGDREFEVQAAAIIAAHLREIVRDELFLAQARASLTPEERKGLFSLMRNIREYEIARGGGTRTGAEQRLQAQEGMGLDRMVETHRDSMLIRRLFMQKIDSRVIVSWRDVEREYQRRLAEFNPPATLKVARISVPVDDDARREQVERRLGEGEPFDAIAESIGQGGVWQQFQLGPEGVGSLEIAPVLKNNLDGLAAGETSAPFQIGSSMWWLHVIDIEQPKARSLYDIEVQQGLTREIQNLRRNQEEGRYLRKLLDHGILSELDSMLERLVRIAAHRYDG